MNYIDAVSSGYTSSLSKETKTDSVGKDAFLKMLIAQLQNQDPLNPMNGADITAQLAQFSSLEQLTSMNDQMGALSLNQTVSNNVQAVSLIGKEITAAGDTIQADGKPVEVAYHLSGDVQKGTVKIYSSDGNLVKTIEIMNQKAGDNSVVWDCGSTEKGVYTFDVSAESSSNEPVDVSTLITGQVTGVNFEDGSSYIMVGNMAVPFENISCVKSVSPN